METAAAAHFLKCSENVLHFVVHIAFVMIVVCIFALLLLRQKDFMQSNSRRNSLMMAATRVSIELSAGDRSPVVCRWPWPLPVSRTGVSGGSSSTNSRSDHQILVHAVFLFYRVLTASTLAQDELWKKLVFQHGAKCRKQNRPSCFQLVCMSAIMSEVSVRHATRQGQAHVPGSGSNLGSEVCRHSLAQDTGGS